VGWKQIPAQTKVSSQKADIGGFDIGQFFCSGKSSRASSMGNVDNHVYLFGILIGGACKMDAQTIPDLKQTVRVHGLPHSGMANVHYAAAASAITQRNYRFPPLT
jgi:hypothetical protein